MNEQIEQEVVQEQEQSNYKARNQVVAAKENLYDRMNVSVRQLDFFIAGCIVLVGVLIAVGLLS